MKHTAFNIALLFWCIVLLLVYKCSYASEIEIGYNFYTHHLGRTEEQLNNLNENNNGVCVSYNNWETLFFKTSKNKDGIFLGRNFWEYDYDPFDIGLYGGINLHGGVLKGYSHASVPSFKGWIIMIAPSFELGYKIDKYCIAAETLTSFKPWNGRGLTAWIVKSSITW